MPMNSARCGQPVEDAVAGLTAAQWVRLALITGAIRRVYGWVPRGGGAVSLFPGPFPDALEIAGNPARNRSMQTALNAFYNGLSGADSPPSIEAAIKGFRP
jgi:hypothetical protein